MTHSRRDALKLLGAGAASQALAWTCGPALAQSREPRAPLPGKARYFPLSQVRLGEGPFLQAQKLDENYLLRLEPDRMLHNFLVNAGLPPKAPVYGGWESVEPWIEIRCHGHTLGHYLTACACMYESTGDVRFAHRVDYIANELNNCQARNQGWLSAFPDGVTPLLDSLAGKPFPGVPWYTLHKILAGLRDGWLHAQSESCRSILVSLAHWVRRICEPVPEDVFQKMLDREHGGMNEVLADVFVITGDARFAHLARRFCHEAVLRPLVERRDALDGLHSNTQIPKVIGFQRLADIAGEPELQTAAEFFWKTVVDTRSFATGGHGDVEHFFPRDEFVKHLGSAKTMETCCTHNLMRLTRALHARDPQARYFDYFERALWNGILAAQDPETGMNTYFQATRPGYVRLYHTPYDSFWCCTGSGIENHARYGESIYAHDDGALHVNLYLSSTLQWEEAGMTVRQTTRFPDEDHSRLLFDCRDGQPLKLKLRHPAWCAVMQVTRNGVVSRSRQPGSYFEVPGGPIQSGDVVEVRLPMRLALEPLPNTEDHAALSYGPIVLAARLGTQGLTPGSQLIVNERESGKMLQADVKIPRWTRPLEQLVKRTRRTDAAHLVFRTTGFAGGESVELIPWFRLAHERYNLYWRRTSG